MSEMVINSFLTGGGDVTQGMDYVEGDAAYLTAGTYATAYTAVTACGYFQTLDASGVSTLIDFMGSLFSRICRVEIDSSGFLNVECANGRIKSINTVNDGIAHSFWWQYTNGGAFTFEIDSVAADDVGFGSRVVPSTNLPTGGSSTLEFGRRRITGGLGNYTGRLGFVGINDNVVADPDDFFDPAGNPLVIDEVTWPQWGAQPEWWNAAGTMDDNKGSDAEPLITFGSGPTGPTDFT